MSYKELLDKITFPFALTMVAYFGAYVFEVAYLNHFGINIESARVTVNSFLLWSSSIFIIVLTFKDLIEDIWWRMMNRWRKLTIIMVISTAYICLFMLIQLFRSGVIDLSILSIGSVLILLTFGIPRRNTKLSTNNKSEKKYVKTEFSNTITAIAAVLFFTALMSYLCGAFYGSFQGHMKSIVSGEKRFAIVAEYDNMLIGKQVSSGGVLLNDILYIDISEGAYHFQNIMLKKPHHPIRLQIFGKDLYYLIN